MKEKIIFIIVLFAAMFLSWKTTFTTYEKKKDSNVTIVHQIYDGTVVIDEKDISVISRKNERKQLLLFIYDDGEIGYAIIPKSEILLSTIKIELLTIRSGVVTYWFYIDNDIESKTANVIDMEGKHYVK